MTRKEISRSDWRIEAVRKPEPVALSDFSLLRAEKAIQGILSESFEIRWHCRQLRPWDLEEQVLCYVIADEREIIFLQTGFRRQRNDSELYFELIMMMEAVPLRFVTAEFICIETLEYGW